ncbi:MAG: hypothetical protein ACK5YR_04855 [Pirellula sp.]|jgi:hypothetical protein
MGSSHRSQRLASRTGNAVGTGAPLLGIDDVEQVLSERELRVARFSMVRSLAAIP